MLRGFYAAAQGMIAQERRTDMLTNNMANAKTPGFKADQSVLRAFPEMLLQVQGQTTIPTDKPLNLPFSRKIGSINTGVYMQEAIPLFSQGDLEETGNVTDLALQQASTTNGADFFTVQNSNGDVRYTRDGNFTIDGAGYLTTNDGAYVLDEQNKRIQLHSNQLIVLADGTVQDNGKSIARLNISFASNPTMLKKDGNGLYQATTPLPTANGNAGASYTVHQGSIERSNVDTAKTMTDMMAAYRSFEANQKILQAYDKSLEKTVNEIGRI